MAFFCVKYSRYIVQIKGEVAFMKLAKSYKFILLLVAFVLSLAMAIGGFTVTGAKADTATLSPTKYFEFSSGVEAEFSDGALKATVKDGSAISFNNELVISDLSLELSVPTDFTATVVITSNSYYIHGNKNADGDFITSIENEIKLSAGAQTVKIGVDDNGYVICNGSAVASDKFYRVKEVNDCAIGKVEIKFASSKENAQGEFSLTSVDQKASDVSANYKQTFAVADGKLEKIAAPRIVVNEDFYTQTAKGKYTAYKFVGNGAITYDVNASAYSLTEKVSSSNIYVAANDEYIWRESVEKPNTVAFKKTGTALLSLTIDGYVDGYKETISVEVMEKDVDVKAPEYGFDQEAYDGFMAVLEKEYRDVEANTSVALGSTLEIPSMADLVFDDYSSYSDLSSTTYYKAKTESTSSKMEFDLNEVSNYLFYVRFKDASGNIMDDSNFMEIDEDDPLKVNYGIYGEDKTVAGYVGNFIFRFVINDDANIVITPAAKQGAGYIGVKYTASKFTIKANGYKTEYKLYYNDNEKATEDSDGWKEIPKASSITDKAYVSADGYTYDQIQEFAYDGSLTFNPVLRGAYKIECTATSDVSPRSSTASTVIVVENEPTFVKVDTKWLQNNVWSVVFLSIGTLCLIAIIVLLFVKPKEDKDND